MDPPSTQGPGEDEVLRTPIVTIVLCAACVLVFLGTVLSHADQSPDKLTDWGYVNAFDLWNGAYWGLLSSNLVHLSVWHLAFNLYWLWILGSVAEHVLGPLRYLGVVLAAAWITSSADLAVSGDMGHGISGVDYALFGLAWASRRQFPVIDRLLSRQDVMILWLWLPAGLVLTWAGLMNVGNAAHASGVVVGLVAAYGLVSRPDWRRAAWAVAGCLIVLSMVPLFWMPWSSTWIGYRAYKADLAGEGDTAIAGYQRYLHQGGDPAWALANLAALYGAKGAEQECRSALTRLRDLDPNTAAEVETIAIGKKAHRAHLAGDYEAAISGYQQYLSQEKSDRVWALENLALAYAAKGVDREYRSTLALLRELDATAAARVESQASQK
jgi:membrane associated rhomboid family serine protease